MAGAEVGDPAAGYALTPPEGWTAEPGPGRIVLAAPAGTVAVVAMPHAGRDVPDMAPIFEGGWQEPGVDLDPVAPLTQREDGSGVMDLAGTADGEAATGRLVLLFNPAGGGLILLGLARPGQDAELAPSVDELAGQVRFSPPETSELIQAWDALLRGRTLVYVHSYTSAGGGDVPGGGFSEREDIALLEDGSFRRTGDFSIAVGGSGGGEVSEPVTGSWRIVVLAGQPMLELQGPDGATTHTLSQGDGADQVLLDGRRFFVTDGSA